MDLRWFGRVRTIAPLAAFQMITSFVAAAATKAPSGEITLAITGCACSSVRFAAPVTASHTLTDLSSLPEISLRPSREYDTDQTTSECPMYVRRTVAVLRSHSLTVRSQPPEANWRPSGE